MEPQDIYIVQGITKGGTITYKCPTPEWAVRKHRDMVTSQLSDVTITGPDGRVLSLAALESVAVEDDVPKARVLSRQS